MSIPTDDSNTNTGPSDDDAVAALMGTMVPKGAEEADDDGEQLDDEDVDDQDGDEADQDDDEGDEDDAGDENDEGDDGDEGQAPAAITDDAVVSVVVDGEAQEFTVGALKRLAGQEASLTRKSQEADLVGQRAASVLQGSLGLVLEDLEAYQGLDWVLEGQRMEPSEFAWHRENYTKLQGRYQTLMGAARNFSEQAEARQAEQLADQARDAVQVLSDPKTGIQGFGPELYGDIVKFAIDAGLPEDDVSQIVNPDVLKIINDARLYRQAQKAAGSKVQMAPKRVRRSSGDESITPDAGKAQKALERKVRTGQGSDDDAMALLMGRWGVKNR